MADRRRHQSRSALLDGSGPRLSGKRKWLSARCNTPRRKKIIGFRYENDIVITKDGCEVLSKYPLGIEEIS
jgi:Xaa-Pro aminopeptidase